MDIFGILTFFFYYFGCFVFNLLLFLLPVDQHPSPAQDTFDYIIVGAGTSGLFIASQLHSNDILLIEAGSHVPWPLTIMPMLGPMLQGTRYDWQHRTTPQRNACLALRGNQSAWPMGKAVGGSSMLNNLIYASVEEEYQLDEVQVSSMEVRESAFFSRLGEAFVEAMGTSASIAHVMLKDGKRFTTKDLFGERGRGNLVTATVVTRLHFDPADGSRVVGVEALSGGNLRNYFARKRVVLAAGVVGSPKILLQSGIGPGEELKEVGIEVRKDLPAVGRNLKDHLTTGIDLIALNSSLGLKPYDIFSPKSLANYFLNHSGPLAFTGCDAIGFKDDIGFMVIPTGASADGGALFRENFNFRDEVWIKYFQPLVSKESATILPILLRPKSSGFVRLRDLNPLSPPIIDPRYLSAPEDLQALLKAIRLLEKVLISPQMQTLGARINPEPFPGCETHQFASDAYFECYIRQLTITAYHPVGTCRMGSDPRTSVVKPSHFVVHGFLNLHIVDGSILPEVGANPTAQILKAAQSFVNKENSILVGYFSRFLHWFQ